MLGIGDRPPQHEFAEPIHQAGLFRHRDEHRRRNDPARGWFQRSRASTPAMVAAVGLDDGLVVDVEGARGERARDFALDEALLLKLSSSISAVKATALPRRGAWPPAAQDRRAG